MGTDITKAQPQNGMQPTWKRLYEADWEQGFNTFMLILAQQYKIELMIQIGNQKQPSPVIEFWRERMQGLSPKQMIAGLRSWQSTGSGSFQPTPENVREWAEGEPSPDAPKARTKPDCEYCGGSGHRYADGRKWSERDGKPKTMTRCNCAVVTYQGVVYEQPQLMAAPEDRRKDAEKLVIPETPQAKAMPRVRPDLDLDRNAEKLRQQAETLLKGKQ